MNFHPPCETDIMGAELCLLEAIQIKLLCVKFAAIS